MRVPRTDVVVEDPLILEELAHVRDLAHIPGRNVWQPLAVAAAPARRSTLRALLFVSAVPMAALPPWRLSDTARIAWPCVSGTTSPCTRRRLRGRADCSCSMIIERRRLL